MGNNKDRQEFEVVHQGIVRCIEGGGDPSIYREAHEIDWRFRIKLQAVIQEYVDAAISSTINVSENTTVEEIKEIYMAAWKAKLKGITIYREGSREGVLVSKEYKQSEQQVDTDTKIYKFIAESKDKFYVAISYRDSNITKPYQIFITNYKKSQDDRLEKVAAVLQTLFDTTDALVEKQLLRCKLNIDKITRLISLAMKENKVKEVVEVLEPLAIVGTLPYYLIKILSIEAEGDCPDCGNKLIREGGCIICSQGCGWSKC
jgi:ribonucleoside-diphosphate reductase alpha chain